MTPRRRSAALSALSAAIALLVPAALAQAVPVMTTSTSGSMFTIDITGAGANKAVWFLQLPAGIDRSVLANVFDTTAAGAQLIHTGRTDATGSFHISFAVTAVPQDAEYAAYTPWAGIRFLGTMVPNPSVSTVLEPGVGFLGPTTEPGQIGTGTAKAIARWDVVPYQTIVEATTPTFKVGVVAFHIAGIQKVSFSLEGGPWVDARSMTLNPQTGVVEYCATIDASDFASDRPIELRAIAYPKAAAPQARGTGAYPGGGFPRLLESMWLYVDADAAQVPKVAYCSPSGSDTTGTGTASNPLRSPWRAAQAVHNAGNGNADGGIVYMGAGTYNWGTTPEWPWTTPATGDQWLTFRAWPGVARDQVRIVSGGYPGMGIDRVRLHDLTLNWHVSGDDGGGGGGGSDKIWLDHVTCQGAGISTSVHFAGWTPAFMEVYWTDSEVSDDAASVPTGAALLRNVSCQRVRQGPARPKLVVNCTWDTINAGGTSTHPNFISWNFAGPQGLFENAIVYGATVTNCAAQGFFFKDTGALRNAALVNIALELQGSGGSPIGQNCQAIDHFLMLNITHLGPSLRWQMPQASMTNLSIRGSHFGRMSLDGADSVNSGWFDSNSYGLGFGAITPGTSVSTADPQLTNTFMPGPNSPLRHRVNPLLVSIDKDGVVRNAPATIGAVE